MSANNIRAGGAYVELTIRDKINQGLRRASARLAAFAKVAESISGGLRFGGSGLSSFGTRLAAIGGVATAGLASTIRTFLELAKAAREAGRAMGADRARSLALEGALGRLAVVFDAIRFVTASAIAEPLSRLIDILSAAGLLVVRFIRQNETLAVVLASLAVLAVVAGGAFIVLGTGLSICGVAFAGFALLASAAAAVLAFLLTPIGLLTLGLIAAAAAVVVLGIVFRKELASMLVSAKGIALAFGGDFAKNLIGSIESAIAFLESEIDKAGLTVKAAIPVFTLPSEIKGGGSSRGQFGGFRAESLSIGSGGGSKDDRRHAELLARFDKLISAVRAIDVPEPAFK